MMDVNKNISWVAFSNKIISRALLYRSIPFLSVTPAAEDVSVFIYKCMLCLRRLNMFWDSSCHPALRRTFYSVAWNSINSIGWRLQGMRRRKMGVKIPDMIIHCNGSGSGQLTRGPCSYSMSWDNARFAWSSRSVREGLCLLCGRLPPTPATRQDKRDWRT